MMNVSMADLNRVGTFATGAGVTVGAVTLEHDDASGLSCLAFFNPAGTVKVRIYDASLNKLPERFNITPTTIP